jgi:RNA polymerase sigma-70 factor, ECF subfamily
MTTEANNSDEQPVGLPAVTSISLIDGVQRQDPSAWARLVRIWTPFVFARCRNSGFSLADAEDITQNVFAKVFAGIDQFRRDGERLRFRFWIAAITRNEIAEFCRRNKNRPAAVGGSDFRGYLESIQVSDSEDLDEWCSSQMVLHRALAVIRTDFKEQTWLAFWMVRVEGRSTAEVAQRLGISTGAVRQAVFRVSERLREVLSELL